MTQEAIENEVVQDVSATVEEQAEAIETEVKQPLLTPREEKLAALNKKHDESHTRHFDPDYDPEAEDAEQADEVEPEPVVAATEEVKPEPAKVESPVRQNEKGEWVMKLKVNGVEVERSLDQITATAQKHESADVRLQQATQRQRELDEYQKVLDNEYQRLTQQQNTQPSKQDAGPNAQEAAKKLMEQIYDGNTDEATQLLVGLLEQGRQQQPTLDTAELTRQATQQAIQEMERRSAERDYNSSLQRGVNWLNETHSDLVSDRDMLKFIDLKTEEIEKANPTLAPEEVIKKAAEEVAKRFGKTKTDPVESIRTQNKATIVPQPKRQANSRHSVPKKPEVDNSPASVVERMKQQRQSVANRPVN